MTTSIRLDVFGRQMLARLVDQRWQLLIVGNEGKSRPIPNLIIPSHIITEDTLIEYLNDVYHEGATPEKPTVKVIEDKR